MKLWRFQFSVLAFLLALLVVSGSALPSPMLWQCHHASMIAPFAARPAAMPCRMASDSGMMRGRMACCPAPEIVPTKTVRAASGTQEIRRPPCHPTLVALTNSPALPARVSHLLHPPLLMLALSGPLPAPLSLFTPVTLSLRQRPPPDGLFRSDALSRPRLRAPPAA